MDTILVELGRLVDSKLGELEFVILDLFWNTTIVYCLFFFILTKKNK